MAPPGLCGAAGSGAAGLTLHVIAIWVRQNWQTMMGACAGQLRYAVWMSFQLSIWEIGFPLWPEHPEHAQAFIEHVRRLVILACSNHHQQPPPRLQRFHGVTTCPAFLPISLPHAGLSDVFLGEERLRQRDADNLRCINYSVYLGLRTIP